MPDARSEVQIVISGTAVGLQEALGQAQQALGRFGTAAGAASAQTGARLAQGEARAAHEATSLAERVKVAADAVGFLGLESGESVGKVFLLRDALGEMGEAFGGLSGAISGGIGAALAFGAIDFVRGSVEEAMSGQAAWDQLTASYKGNRAELERVKGSIEDNKSAWETLGIAQGQVAAMAVRARQAGMDPTTILGDPARLADVAAILHETIPQALDSIARPRGAMQVLQRLGLSRAELRAATRELTYLNAQQRALYLENLVQQHGGAGAGLAIAGTAAGSFAAFHAAMGDLKEEVGTALLPALTALAQAMTHLLQDLEAITKPFGGLAKVLQVLLLPMLVLGLKMFLGLRGALGGMVDLLLGRLVGAFSQTAQSMAEADDEARKLADDIAAIPPEADTYAHFFPDAAKEAWMANVQKVRDKYGAVTTKAAFDDAAALTDLGTFEEAAAGASIPVPLVAEDQLSKGQVAADARAASGARVTVPIVADDQLSAATVAQNATAAQGAIVTVPVVAENDIAASAAADAAAGVKPARISVPVHTGAVATSATERQINALDAYARAHPAQVGVFVAAQGTGTDVAAAERKIADLEAKIGQTEQAKRSTSSTAADLARYDARIARLRSQQAGLRAQIGIPAEVSAAEHDIKGLDDYAKAHPAEVRVTTQQVAVGQVEGEITRLDAFASKHGVSVPVKASGTVTVTGGTVPITPVLSKGAAADEQRIRNQITSGVGTDKPVRVPVEAQNNLGTQVAADVAGEQKVLDQPAHHLHVFVDAIKEGAAWGAMGLAFSVADMIVNSKVTHVEAQMPAPKTGGKAPAAIDVNVMNQPTVNVGNYGSLADAMVQTRHGQAALRVTGSVGIQPNQSITVSKMPEISATAVLGGTTTPLAVKQSGPWSVKIPFDPGTIVTMAIAGVLGSAFLQGGKNLLGWLKGVLPAIRFGGRGTGLPALPPEAEGDLGKILQFPKGAGGGGIAADIVQGVERDIGPAMEGAAPVIESAVALQMGEAAVAGLAEAAPTLAMAAADAGGIEAAGFLEAASAGLATPLVALILGGLTVASAAVFTHGFGLLGQAGKKESDKLKKTLDLGAMFKPLGSAIGGALGKVGSAFGSLGGKILDGIKTGIIGNLAKLNAIAWQIIDGIQRGVKSGIITLINGILTMFNNIFKQLSSVWGIGKAFEKLRLPLIPVPRTSAPGGGSSSSSHGGGGGQHTHAGLSLIDPSLVAAAAHVISTAGVPHATALPGPTRSLVAGRLAALHPSAASASAAPAAAGVQQHTHHVTLNAPITINGATDPSAVGRQVSQALADFVQGARSQRRLVG